jgi:hypothetical protein
MEPWSRLRNMTVTKSDASIRTSLGLHVSKLANMNVSAQSTWSRFPYILSGTPRITARMGAFSVSDGANAIIWGGRSSPASRNVTFFSDGFRIRRYYGYDYLSDFSIAGTTASRPLAKSEGGMTIVYGGTYTWVYMFGGRGAGGSDNKLHAFSFTSSSPAWADYSNTFRNPPPRLWGLSLSSIGKMLYLYGGQQDNGTPNTRLMGVRTLQRVHEYV